MPHESLSPLILFTIFSKGREARVRKKIYKSIRIFRGKADVGAYYLSEEFIEQLMRGKEYEFDEETLSEAGLTISQTGNTAERNSSESREWAEKIEAFGENQFPKNCRDVFSELNDLTAEARNKFTEEENG